ncbi:MAG: hypothetical protein HND48_01635 [Chloroflexi bacterium]|nr:hypothetical protein [Chloroflexota bacterium]
MHRKAQTAVPIHPLLAERWSSRAFSDDPVAPELVLSLLEAARWSASCFNGQPWRFIVATRDDPEQHARLAACFTTSNQRWVPRAWVVMIALAVDTFRSGRQRESFGAVRCRSGRAKHGRTGQRTWAERAAGGGDRHRAHPRRIRRAGGRDCDVRRDDRLSRRSRYAGRPAAAARTSAPHAQAAERTVLQRPLRSGIRWPAG